MHVINFLQILYTFRKANECLCYTKGSVAVACYTAVCLRFKKYLAPDYKSQ